MLIFYQSCEASKPDPTKEDKAKGIEQGAVRDKNNIIPDRIRIPIPPSVAERGPSDLQAYANMATAEGEGGSSYSIHLKGATS